MKKVSFKLYSAWVLNSVCVCVCVCGEGRDFEAAVKGRETRWGD